MEGVFSNTLELMDSSEVRAKDASDTGRDFVLRVELGGGTGGIKKDVGVRIEVVTLLKERDDVDKGVGKGEAETLDTVVELRDETEEMVDDGRGVCDLAVTERATDCLPGVEYGLPVKERLAMDIVMD
jgi:hypothetical protein